MQRSTRSNSRRGVIIMLVSVMMPFLLIPAVGLAIDATIIHIVQTKLQAAVDAAALGAGRLLGTSANATEIAGEFFNANFTVGANGFWGATLPNPSTNPNIVVVTGITKQVTVNAMATVPTLFMRILGFNSAQVSAVGQATRRDARFVFVLDRSGSMATTKLPDGNYPIQDVVSYAQSLIKEFTPGLDEVGLVVFDGSAVVGYPSTNSYSTTVGTVASPGTGGPDTSFWDGTTSGKSTYPQDAVYQVGQVSASGGTGTADALALAYIELQKAHLRDLAANGSDSKLNAILLFTDGVPSAISLYANDPNHSGPWLTSSSGCTNYNSGTSNPIYFWSVASGSPPYTTMYGGNYQLASYYVDSTHTPLWWMQNPNSSIELADTTKPGNESGGSCASNIDNSGTYGWYGYYGNLSQIPATDKWGNSTAKGDGNGYQDSYFLNTSGSYQANVMYNGTAFSATFVNPSSGHGSNASTNSYQWGLAMWDAADAAAKTIRTDANYTSRGESSPLYIQIFTIGYTGNGGTDAGLLKRIANDPGDTESPNALPSAWSTQPQGKFCLGTDSTSLAACFNSIGSALLHLTR
ncbi:MAG TPA: pilus assembly protein TadG-related protein [Bryobacteraceae bacterium]|nr:pilus assembly protein TadG-related protein [Bryobacteraceae bacterium]